MLLFVVDLLLYLFGVFAVLCLCFMCLAEKAKVSAQRAVAESPQGRMQGEHPHRDIHNRQATSTQECASLPPACSVCSVA